MWRNLPVWCPARDVIAGYGRPAVSLLATTMNGVSCEAIAMAAVRSSAFPGLQKAACARNSGRIRLDSLDLHEAK